MGTPEQARGDAGKQSALYFNALPIVCGSPPPGSHSLLLHLDTRVMADE